MRAVHCKPNVVVQTQLCGAEVAIVHVLDLNDCALERRCGFQQNPEPHKKSCSIFPEAIAGIFCNQARARGETNEIHQMFPMHGRTGFQPLQDNCENTAKKNTFSFLIIFFFFSSKSPSGPGEGLRKLQYFAPEAEYFDSGPTDNSRFFPHADSQDSQVLPPFCPGARATRADSQLEWKGRAIT